MWLVCAFSVLFLISSAVAFTLGGVPERLVGLILVLASVLSILVKRPLQSNFTQPDMAMLLVDFVATIAIVSVALRANRIWPLWVSALMLQQVLGHVLKMAQPDLFPWLYWLVSTFWGFPVQTILMIATISHWRRTRTQAVKPWSDFSRRSATPQPAIAPML
jgi:hypothetical protein